MPETVPVKDLDHLLRGTLGPDLRIRAIEWKPLTDPGENYGSLIYSVALTVSTKKITEVLNLVVKIPPPSKYLRDLFNSPVNFWKEQIFYEKVAPKFIQLQLESCIKPDKIVNLVPRYYGGRLGLEDPKVFDGQAAVVMENLIPRGYAVRDRLLGMDLEHTELVVGGLAKLHAIVIGLKIKYPEFFRDTVIPALVDAVNDTAREGNIGMLKIAHNAYKELTEAKPYLDRIDKTLIHDYESNCVEIKVPEPWGTMVHSDFWSNNILFKYNTERRPTSMKIVDFQFGCYNSGALDLIFFLLSSVQEKVLDNNLDDLLDMYYESFIDCLKSVKVDTDQFTRDGFYREVNRSAPLVFGQCISMITVITAERGTANGLENMDKDSNFSSIKDQANSINKLLNILKIYVKKQWLVD